MADIGGMSARLAVVGVLAFGFLSFYTWFAFNGLEVLTVCVKEGIETAKLPASKCQKAGLLMTNVRDLFSPVSGVVTGVALSALAYKPDEVDRFAGSLRTGFSNMGNFTFLDIMIVVFLLGWMTLGLTISFQTGDLSLAQAKEWNPWWLHALGWATALTAVALWLGVPKSAPKPEVQTQPNPAPNPINP